VVLIAVNVMVSVLGWIFLTFKVCSFHRCQYKILVSVLWWWFFHQGPSSIWGHHGTRGIFILLYIVISLFCLYTSCFWQLLFHVWLLSILIGSYGYGVLATIADILRILFLSRECLELACNFNSLGFKGYRMLQIDNWW
jgi:hypothetical protein